MTPAKAKRGRFDRTIMIDCGKCMQNADEDVSKEMSEDRI